MTTKDDNKGMMPMKDIFAFAFDIWGRQKKLLAVAVFLMISATIVDAIIPPYMGKLVDALIANSDDSTSAWRYLVIFVSMWVTFYALRSAAMYVYNIVASRNLFDIVTEGLERVQRFSTDWHANAFAGATVRKITRGMWSFDTFEDVFFISLMPASIMLVTMSIVLITHIPLVGIFTLFISVVYIVVSIYVSLKWLSPKFTISAAQDTKIGARLADVMTGIHVVKSFATEPREDATFNEIADKWRTLSLNAWQAAQTAEIVRSFIRIVMMIGMIGLVIWLQQQGRATTGDIAVVLTSYFVISGYLRDIGMQISNLQKSMSEISDVVSFWKHRDPVADKADAKKLVLASNIKERAEIRFDNVTFAYANAASPLYDHLNVTIKPGEKVALVGVSGSGKTSFTKLVQRLYDIDGGAILIDGQNIADVTQASLREQIALVAQDPVLFHRSLATNIAYGRPDATRAEIEAAAKQAFAHEFIMRLPQGYDTLVGERGVKLSGGERQRVAIARAILADRPILILDEATSSLDTESEHFIQQAMDHLMEGRTTIVIAHRLSTIRSVDRILVFEHGRIVEQGSHAALMRKEGSRYRQLHDLQMIELQV